MGDIDELVARPIARELERSDVVAKRNLERCLGPERELADARMQPVGADKEVDLATRSIAVPVVTSTGQVAAAMTIASSSSGPPLQELVEQFLPMLRAASSSLGSML